MAIWPYLHPSISTALMRPRRPKQYCLQLVIYTCMYVCKELKKVRGWTTFDVKKIENVIKTFRSETFFSNLQLLNKKEL